MLNRALCKIDDAIVRGLLPVVGAWRKIISNRVILCHEVGYRCLCFVLVVIPRAHCFLNRHIVDNKLDTFK